MSDAQLAAMKDEWIKKAEEQSGIGRALLFVAAVMAILLILAILLDVARS